MRRHRFLATFGIICGLFFACCGAVAASDLPPDRLKLWDIVHNQCVAGQMARQDPSPCVLVNVADGEDGGYAVLPDRNGVAQFLLIPTRRITGIEDPAVLEDALPPYWSIAWEARHYVSDKLDKTLPPAAIGLAVNSYPSRSQDQLHIHIDCIRPEVASTLSQHAADIGQQWAPLPVSLAGQAYMARRVAGNDLAKDSPFKQLTQLGRIMNDQGSETLVVTGLGNDLVMLESHADTTTRNRGHGEDLLDADCAIAKTTP